MSIQTNRLKSDLPKNKETEEPKAEKASGKAVKEVSSVKFPSLRTFLTDELTHKIAGLFLILVSIYLLVAFTSFIFTWKSDFSEVNGSWSAYLQSDVPAANWLGHLGAIASQQFVYNWFGVSSYAFVFLFFIMGFWLLTNIAIVSIKKAFQYSFFLVILLSISFGYVFSGIYTLRFMGGAFGYHSTLLLYNFIGFVGTGALLVFLGLSFAIAVFNLSFTRKENPLLEPSVNKTEIVPEEEEIAPIVTVKNEVKNSLTDNLIVQHLETEDEEDVSEGDLMGMTTYTKVVAQNQVVVSTVDQPIANHFSFEVNEPDGVETTNVIATTEVADFNLEINKEEIITAKKTEHEEIDFEEEDVEDFLHGTELPSDNNNLTLAIEQIKEEIIDSDDALQIKPLGEFDPTLELSSYKFPTLDLLENYGGGKIQVDREELEANKNRIVETLGHYNIEIDKIKANIGPTVTLYEIVPKAGVRISKIKNLEDDIALSLAALGIRIIAPIPGKGTIGIEVPNQKPEMVAMRSILASEKFQNAEMDLPIALGKTISNEVFVTDLAKMPHLLMAGATGQGKSVGLNALLVSLLYKKHPSQVKFVLVDPKKVELTLFKTIERHFLAKLPGEEEAIITDTKKVVNTLNSLCIEMDQRYDLLKDAQVRNIKEYNAKFIARKLLPTKGHHFLPYIVLVVDEFADLIMTAGKEVEMPIARLAQLARAIGIHLIIATQRPSVNIITGTIKANFPARIAFRVTSKIDSRTILDAGGADQLIGRGDMLLSTGSDLIRLQCAFVDTPEVERITDFIGSQRGYSDAFLLPEYVDEKGEGSVEFNSADRDSLFEDAARIIVQNQQGSASLLQRRLKLGYNRAGRLVDQLEAAGIIGHFEGSKAREVLISDEHTLEEFLSKLK
jgi:S-DNA-T family DNA segregation ATPase FtsK/SpoIIIE